MTQRVDYASAELGGSAHGGKYLELTCRPRQGDCPLHSFVVPRCWHLVRDLPAPIGGRPSAGALVLEDVPPGKHTASVVTGLLVEQRSARNPREAVLELLRLEELNLRSWQSETPEGAYAIGGDGDQVTFLRVVRHPLGWFFVAATAPVSRLGVVTESLSRSVRSLRVGPSAAGQAASEHAGT